MAKSDWMVQFLKEAIPYFPRNALSAAVGRLAATTALPFWFRRQSVEWFAKRFALNMSEAEKPLSSYRTVAELFTRNLRPGVRPINEGLLHPADSNVTFGGKIETDTLIQAKGSEYSLRQFLGSEDDAKAAIGGTLLTYYLCPTDYHHVHSPVDGRILAARALPGDLWPVNPWSLATHERIFERNERIVVSIEFAQGRAFLVMVGATVVGQMTTSFDSSLRGNTSREKIEKRYENGIPIARGERIGTFHMGSTVIMIYAPGVLPPEFAFPSGHVKYGQTLYLP